MSGWQTRGDTWSRLPTRIIDHHDASSRKSGEWGALAMIHDGNLSQFQVARCLDGRAKLAVIACGRSPHAGYGGPWAEVPKDSMNYWGYGAEKANDGLGEPYTSAAHYATDALFYAVAVESGTTPAGRFPVGHKEWAPKRKVDPKYDMDWRRDRVGSFAPATPPAPVKEEDMPLSDKDLDNITNFAIPHVLVKVHGTGETEPIRDTLHRITRIEGTLYALQKDVDAILAAVTSTPAS